MRANSEHAQNDHAVEEAKPGEHKESDDKEDSTNPSIEINSVDN